MMFRALALAALVFGASLGASQAETTNLPAAVMVEWTVANCPPEGISPLLVAMSLSVIDAAPAAEVEDWRARMREGAEANYADKDAACADMLARLVENR
jgi:hypothetical protein